MMRRNDSAAFFTASGRGGVAVFVVALFCLLFGERGHAQACAGDCNGDDQLAVSELVRAVRIALGSEPAAACTAADVDRSGAVGINDLLLAVTASLGPCSPRLTATGMCMQPGPSGLQACSEGTMVSVRRCNDAARCLTDPNALTTIAFGTIGTGGRFTLEFSTAQAGSASLVFEAQVETTTTYRAINFGLAGTGGGSGIGFDMILLAPASEAAARLLAENGFENFSRDEALDVIDAIDQANADTSFVGLSAQAGAALAVTEARNDPAVVAAIQAALSTPTPTATSTPTRTATPTLPGGGNGAEFIVNTYTLGNEYDPRVATNGSGRFVVVWEAGEAGSFSSTAVVGRIYDGAGNPLGADFRIDTFTLGQSDSPDVAMDAAGNFVVVWESDSLYYPGGIDGIAGQRFDSAGQRRGSEFQVNPPVTHPLFVPRVGVEPSGRFVVVWADTDGSGDAILGQRFTSAGAKSGTEFQVNSVTLGFQTDPSLIAVEGGEFVVVWSSESGQDGDGDGVFAQGFDSAGNRSGVEFQINRYTLGDQDAPVLVAAEGGFVILWRSQDQDGSDAGIFAQLFTDDQVPFGGEFQVNSFTLGAQDDVSATVDAGGGLVAVWESEEISGSVGQDGSDDGVFGQRFDSEGLPAGEEFQVNAFTIGPQDGAGAVATADGFLVVWESQGQDGAGDGIFGRRFRFDP